MHDERIIWQYWETRGSKPRFVDGLHKIARRNAGARVIQITPETLPYYLPDLPNAVHSIEELAHKADMIRTRLVARYGGMWLDSDAVVLRDLNWIFDFLETAQFVGFNDHGDFSETQQQIRVNCFAAPAGSPVMSEWVAAQEAKLPQGQFRWQEIGTELIDLVCLRYRNSIKILPFRLICPVSWKDVRRFGSPWKTPRGIIEDVHVVMLSNKSLERHYPELRRLSVEDIVATNTYLAHFIRRAIDPAYVPEPSWWSLLRYLTGWRRVSAARRA